MGAVEIVEYDPSWPDAFRDVASRIRMTLDDRASRIDTSCCQQDPDIKSTTRRVWTDEAGRRWLTITFVAYEQLIPYWSVYVPIDSRGGPGIDYKVLIFDPGTNQPGCSWWRYHSGKRHKGIYHAPIHGDRATCRVPLGGVHPEKRIRWRLYSPPGAEGHGIEDP